MANHKSAKKAAIQAEKRRLKNKAYLSRCKSLAKEAIQALREKSPEAKKKLRQAISQIDKACQKGIIKPNKASRWVSSLARLNKA